MSGRKDEDLSTDEANRLAMLPSGYIPPRARHLSEYGVASCPQFQPGEDNAGALPIFYRPDQLVVPGRFADEVERRLPGLGGGERADGQPTGRSEAVIFKVNADALAVTRELKRLARKGKGDLSRGLVVGPHHVMTITPKPKIGPGGDPVPADAAWKPGAQIDGSVTVGIVDTGIWHDPDAGGLEAEQRSGDDDPIDVGGDGIVDWYGAGHGGFIAGVVRGRVSGIPIAVENAFGQEGLTELSVVDQVDEVIDECSLLVLNLSLGSYRDEQFGADMVFLDEAMERWAKTDTLIVAAAGNDGVRQKFYPAAFAADRRYADCVVSVGALEDVSTLGTGKHSRPADFSNHGRWVTAWAPGVDVVSHYPRGLRFEYHDSDGSPAGTAPFTSGFARWSGTSFAAPFVAAEIARFAAENGTSPKDAWAKIRAGRPFVTFWH